MSPRNEGREIVLGIFMLVGMHFLAFYIVLIISGILSYLKLYNAATFFVFGLVGIGIAQLLYVIPVIILLKRQEKWGLMKGVIIGAVITALLNGGCWLLFTSSWR